MPDSQNPEDPFEKELRTFFKEHIKRAPELYPPSKERWQDFKRWQEKKRRGKHLDSHDVGRKKEFILWSPLKLGISFAVLAIVAFFLLRNGSENPIVLAAIQGNDEVRDPELSFIDNLQIDLPTHSITIGKDGASLSGKLIRTNSPPELTRFNVTMQGTDREKTITQFIGDVTLTNKSGVETISKSSDISGALISGVIVIGQKTNILVRAFEPR